MLSVCYRIKYQKGGNKMEVKKVCVVGAGTMGNQIAQIVATGGYQVSMTDIEDRFVRGGLDAITGNLKKYFVDKGKMSQEEADRVIGRIEGTT
ncbi:MAG: 3-hydroxyacyl-CoA dehydrogenase NAD-binding domain-containing protein, partial [Dehalococcoidia bacterium]